jgi:hypothetical protein
MNNKTITYHPRLIRGKEFFDRLRELLDVTDDHELAAKTELPLDAIKTYEKQGKVYLGEAIRLSKLLNIPLKTLLLDESPHNSELN